MLRQKFTVPLLVLLSHVALLPAAEPEAVRIHMRDQFDKPHDIADHRGKIIVLVYGDRRGADLNKALGEKLHVHFHPAAASKATAEAKNAPPASTPTDVQTIAVACIGKVPDPLKGLIRSQFRRGAPELPVWLDFEGRMKEFGFAPGETNLVVIDQAGIPRFRLNGHLSDDSLRDLLQRIESLR